MLTFWGNYYDGQSAEPYAAQVSFDPAALHISYRVPNQSVPVNLYWQAHRIEKEYLPATGITNLHYGSFPGQTLEISQPGFVEAFEEYYRPVPAGLAPTPVQPGKRGLGLISALLIGLLALIPLTYFWILPAAADMAAKRLPKTYEQQIGQLLATHLFPPKSIQAVKTKQLNGFMRQLNFNQPTDLKIYVIQNQVPNAFALPGGIIVVHDTMLPLLETPAELAALLGHEYSHISLRHSLRTLIRSLSGYFLISAIFGDVSAVTAVILQNAHEFKSLAYSRQFEKEADTHSLELLRNNNLDPNGLIQLFKHLQEQSPKQSQQEEYLSSHPLLDSRMAYIRNLIKEKSFKTLPNDSLDYYFKKLQKN